MEEEAQQSSDTNYVVIPKKEIDEELEITFENECQYDQLIAPKVELKELSDNFDETDDINLSKPMTRERMLSEEFIIPKEEIIITDRLLGDDDSENHDDSLIKPIKVELMLSEEIVHFRQQDTEMENTTDLILTPEPSDRCQSFMERTSHPSCAQVECLLEFLERNPSLAKGFSKVPSERDAARRSWEALTLQLNSIEGCAKTWKRWTKYWADKKSAVKKKSALRHRARNRTGAGEAGEAVELSGIEEKILTLMNGESFAIGHRHSGINPLETSTSGPAIQDSASSLAPQIIVDTPLSEIAISMDQKNKLDDELKRKRKLANACLKRHRKKKREQAQQQKLLAQNESKYDNEQIKQITLERRRELSRERSKRYRDKKRLSSINKIEHAIDDTQIPGPSHSGPELTIQDRGITIQNSRPPGTSANINIPSVMNDSVNSSDSENNYAGPLRSTNNVVQANEQSRVLLPDEGNCEINIGDNSPSLQVQAHASVGPTSQFNRSSTYSSYARHSSAHTEFHRQFTKNSFGHACGICERLWFKNDLRNLNSECMKFVKTFLPNVDEHSLAVCSTCRTSIQKESIPSMAVYNGFEYPIIPSNLLNCPLDLVSERMIAPRIPFMQIRRLRKIHGQNEIYGQIINVPIEINTMVNSLPRNVSDDHCIYIHIKRKTIHKSSFLYDLINKRTIKEWLRYLVNTPLYRTYDITIDDQFFDNLHDSRVDGDKHDENYRNEIIENIPIEDSVLAQQQTVMWNDEYLNIAPGENNVPKSLLFEEHAEELSFPSIYLGQFRQFREGITVTPFMMATSELRRSDRRGVTPQHLLYMAMKIMRIRVRDALRVGFKHVGKNSNVTKQEIQSEDCIHGFVESNLAFLRSIPNSTWYWSETKKDLCAMIRQLGKPTVFFTMSANEIGWSDLLQLLYKLNKREYITKETVAELHFMVKSTLVNEDAVTCAVYFNKLVNVIMNILQSKKCSPFRKFRVLHYFKRIEFHRGSPHARILAWLDNAPNDSLNDDYNRTIELVDALISVSASEASGNIKLQTHKHTFTCSKEIDSNGAPKCRCEAPFMPCKETMILCPMEDTAEGFINYRKRYAEIRVSLENEDFVDIRDFYSRNGIKSDDEYYDIIRAGITAPKVFVKREPKEKWHCPFNPFILNIVKSYTDFQFIIEEYSCADYLFEYTNTTNRGVSDLQRKIIETMNDHPEFDIIEIIKKISVNILNQTEITSQEAAWYLLREPLCKSSLSIVYIPTVWPIERQRIRKTIEDSSKLEDTCTDIWKENWFDKYEKRPEYLESVTLAQFVSKYTKNKNGEFIERNEPRIIRYRNYDMSSDFQEHKREMVTLHLPFRSEEVEILADMKFVSIYDDNENIILERRKEFESNINIDK